MLIVPAAEFVERAADWLKDAKSPGGMSPEGQADELRELNFALGQQSPDVEHGYLLGLTVMRVLLNGDLKAREAGVTL